MVQSTILEGVFLGFITQCCVETGGCHEKKNVYRGIVRIYVPTMWM